MPKEANFGLIFVAQALSAGGEIFGQRASRKLYLHSTIRLLLATIVYSALQGFIVLTITQYALPYELTKGEGGISVWAYFFKYPVVWVNATTDAVYIAAMLYVLREVSMIISVVKL